MERLRQDHKSQLQVFFLRRAIPPKLITRDVDIKKSEIDSIIVAAH